MIYHISHNDLDGYSCQVLINKTFFDIKFFNVNYGAELWGAINLVSSCLEKGDLLLITDLNLSTEQCEFLDNASKEKLFEIQVWDHHASGSKESERYDWYYLDTTKSATAITLEKLEEMNFKFSSEEFELVYLVNIYDTWQENNSLMSLAKSLNQTFHDNKGIFPEELVNEERDFLFFMIKRMSKNLMEKNILGAESLIYSLKQEYFGKEHTYNTPMHILQIEFMYEKLIEKNEFLRFELNGLVGEAYFGLSKIFQEFSSIRLKKNLEVDFLVNINNKGYLSLRTQKEIDLSVIAQKYFFGGGHCKASGGSLLNGPNNFKKAGAFEQFLKQIQH